MDKLIAFIFLSATLINVKASSDSCPCLPAESCKNEQDKKFIEKDLTCAETGFIKCCIDDDIKVPVLSEKISSENSDYFNSVSEMIDYLKNLKEIKPESTQKPFDESLITTDDPQITTSNSLNSPEVKLDENLIAKTKEEEKKKLMEKQHDLHLIFPNGEIEAALKLINPLHEKEKATTTERPQRVVIRKRLLGNKNVSESSFEESESIISKAVVEPQKNIERIRQRLTERLRLRLNTTTELPIEVTTEKRKRRKKLKYRSRSTTKAIPSSTLGKEEKEANEKRNETTQSGRLDYQKESEIEIENLREGVSRNQSNFKPRRKIKKLPKVVQMSPIIDNEHEVMIKTVHRTLTGIHKGADATYVRSMVNGYKKEIEEMRKNPPTKASMSTKRSRGALKYSTIAQQTTNEPLTRSPKNRVISRTRQLRTTTQVPPKTNPSDSKIEIPALKELPKLNSLVTLE